VAHYARSDPADFGFYRNLLGGVALLLSPWLLGKLPVELPAIPPAIEFETTAIALSTEQRAAIWNLPPLARGKVIDKLFRQGDLHDLSRTIDDLVDGIVISNKSADLNAATYRDFRRLLSRVSRDLEELETYSGTEWGGDRIFESQIAGRVLRLIVPKGSMNSVQREAIKAATRLARSKGLRLIVTEF
jgi:hypothetical protein